MSECSAFGHLGPLIGLIGTQCQSNASHIALAVGAMDVESYRAAHGDQVEAIVKALLSLVLHDKPDDPVAFLKEAVQSRAAADTYYSMLA